MYKWTFRKQKLVEDMRLAASDVVIWADQMDGLAVTVDRPYGFADVAHENQQFGISSDWCDVEEVAA